VAENDFFRGTPLVDACAQGISREGDAKPRLGVAGLIGKGEATSDQFQFVSFYSDSDRALNRFNRDDQVLFPTLFQNSFQTVQTAAPNPHPLSDLKEGVEGAWDLLGEQPLQILDLLDWNRGCHSLETD
jgi:hypothetical protein